MAECGRFRVEGIAFRGLGVRGLGVRGLGFWVQGLGGVWFRGFRLQAQLFVVTKSNQPLKYRYAYATRGSGPVFPRA